MSFIYSRIDVNIVNHPKAIAAGKAAFGLWSWGISYSQMHMLDGLLPDSSVMAALDADNNLAAATRLVEVGLWERVPNAFRICHYAKKNDTRDVIEDRIQKAKVRKDRFLKKNSLDHGTRSERVLSVDVDVLKDLPVTGTVNSTEGAKSEVTSEQRYLRAYESGISKATGQPFVVAHWDGSLGLLIQAYLKDLRGDALLRSIEDTAFEFARSVLLKGDETRFHSHLAPKGCLRWKGVHNVTYKPRTRSRKCDFCDEVGGHLPNCETLTPPNVVNIFKKVSEA